MVLYGVIFCFVFRSEFHSIAGDPSFSIDIQDKAYNKQTVYSINKLADVICPGSSTEKKSKSLTCDLFRIFPIAHSGFYIFCC
jgi:hypothetical protein